MNRTRTSKNAKRLLVWLLLTMVFGLLPMAAFADDAVEPVVSEEPVQESAQPSTEPIEAPSEPTQEPTQEPEEPADEPSEEEPTEEDTFAAEDEVAVQAITEIEYVAAPYKLDPNNPIRVFHLDCGRKYFSVDEINAIIDLLAVNNYTHLELAVGNQGLRFLLSDEKMTIEANGTTYDGATIKAAISAYNLSRDGKDSLSETDMDAIFAHAKEKNISIIPLLNSPGHMDAIINAMIKVGISDAKYNNSSRTIDVTNSRAVEFAQALIEKYAEYFKSKGCTLFNIGADEYANDVHTQGSMGFGKLISSGQYGSYVTYVNNIARIVKKAGLTPLAFNDGIYFNGNATFGTFDSDIIICYWSSGWGSYLPASVDFLTSKGHQIINTNERWYYVLGRATSGDYNYSKAKSNVSTVKYNVVRNGDSDAVKTVVGCMNCLWCDDIGTYDAAEYANVKYLIETLSANNKDVFKASAVVDPDPTPTTPVESPDLEEKTIEVPVGGTFTVEVDGDVSENIDRTDLEENIATADAKHTKVDGKTEKTLKSKISIGSNSASTTNTGVISDGTHYMVISAGGTISSTTKIDEATVFTVTRSGRNSYTYTYTYTINGNGYYLSINSSNSLDTSKTEYSFSYNTGNGFYKSINSGWWGTTTYYLGYRAIGENFEVYTGSSNGTSSHLYGYTENPTDPVDKTKFTVTGKTVGTTTCIFNGVKYTINVVDKVPDGAMTSNSLTLEYWITNRNVYQTKNTSATNSVTISSTDAATDEGIDVSKVALESGYYNVGNTWTNVYYWQSMRLDSDNKQTTAEGDDETSDGITFTHVRYHNNAWQYKTLDGVWRYFADTDQAVAYYLQKTTVTKEVDTFTKDWGFVNGESDGSAQVALTIAVVYPDGTVSPAEGEMLDNSSTMFNYWDNRDIGIVAPVNNSEYNIVKITVTDGKRNDTSTAVGKWNEVSWEKKTTESGGEWYNETEVWKKSDGTAPMVNGKVKGIVWPSENTAKLVLIYLEAVEKDTNLNVEYWDDNAGQLITRTQISMTYTGTDVPTYDTALKSSDGTVIGVKHDWSSNVKGDADYLPDDAYVTNSSKINQTINKNLTSVPGATGIYKSGIYEYIRAEISEDGKTLTLHYNLKKLDGKTYVIDFGLPIEIPFSAYGIEDATSDVSFDAGDMSVVEKDGQYGHGSIDKDRKIVTYTLTATIDNKIAIPVFMFDGKGNAIQLTVYVVPATNVYYEDSFANVNNGKGLARDAKWVRVNNDANVTQALSELGHDENVYGYDPAYDNNAMFSMNGAAKVTVTKAMSKNWVNNDTNVWPTATFTFKGTGFDIISLTDNNSGAIAIEVNGKTKGKTRNLMVNNYFGYVKGADGWEMTNDATNAFYQIPVMKVEGLPYDEYDVTIKVFYSSVFDQTGGDKYTFWLDAIRVYNPMGDGDEDYNTGVIADAEGYPQYIRLRNAIVKSSAEIKTYLFIEGNSATADVKEYANIGPNNEVYLAKNQAISFKLPESIDSLKEIQIGAKSPNGGAVMTVNGQTFDINTATEMYYTIAATGGLVTITNTGKEILSLTNLKITYTKANTIELAPLTESDAEEAVATVRALLAAPEQPDEPEKTFKPERFDCEWNKNVRKGGRAILTVKASTDVESILIDGEEYGKYVTRTERIGWGRNAQRVTYHEFVYMTTADDVGTINTKIVAVNGEGVQSVAKTVPLTVKESSPIRDWIGGLFGRWF